MAKRSRVSGRPTNRPRPLRPSAGAATPAPRSSPAALPASSLTEAEAERAAELEAQLVAQEKAAARTREAAAAAARDAGRRRGLGREVDPELLNQPLSVRAAHEYAYVARDIRRIALTAGLMVAILFGLAVAINVAGVIKL